MGGGGRRRAGVVLERGGVAVTDPPLHAPTPRTHAAVRAALAIGRRRGEWVADGSMKVNGVPVLEPPEPDGSGRRARRMIGAGVRADHAGPSAAVTDGGIKFGNGPPHGLRRCSERTIPSCSPRWDGVTTDGRWRKRSFGRRGWGLGASRGMWRWIDREASWLGPRRRSVGDGILNGDRAASQSSAGDLKQ